MPGNSRLKSTKVSALCREREREKGEGEEKGLGRWGLDLTMVVTLRSNDIYMSRVTQDNKNLSMGPLC